MMRPYFRARCFRPGRVCRGAGSVAAAGGVRRAAGAAAAAHVDRRRRAPGDRLGRSRSGGSRSRRRLSCLARQKCCARATRWSSAHSQSDPDAAPVASREFSRTERLIVRVSGYAPGTERADDFGARLMSRFGQPLRNLRVDGDVGPTAPARSICRWRALPSGEYSLELTATSAVRRSERPDRISNHVVTAGPPSSGPAATTLLCPAARAGRFSHPRHRHAVRAGAHVDVVLARGGEHLGEGARHLAIQPAMHVLELPRHPALVLHPFEIRHRDAAGVAEKIRE